MIINLIGQPGSGKTTLAKHIIEWFGLHYPQQKIFNLDGDKLRDLFPNKDYGKEGRVLNITRAYDIAKYLNAEGQIVVISMVSPYLELREKLKKDEDVYEFLVYCSTIRGKEHYHVGDFQIPINSFTLINTSNSSILSNLEQILSIII